MTTTRCASLDTLHSGLAKSTPLRKRIHPILNFEDVPVPYSTKQLFLPESDPSYSTFMRASENSLTAVCTQEQTLTQLVPSFTPLTRCTQDQSATKIASSFAPLTSATIHVPTAKQPSKSFFPCSILSDTVLTGDGESLMLKKIGGLYQIAQNISAKKTFVASSIQFYWPVLKGKIAVFVNRAQYSVTENEITQSVSYEIMQNIVKEGTVSMENGSFRVLRRISSCLSLKACEKFEKT